MYLRFHALNMMHKAMCKAHLSDLKLKKTENLHVESAVETVKSNIFEVVSARDDDAADVEQYNSDLRNECNTVNLDENLKAGVAEVAAFHDIERTLDIKVPELEGLTAHRGGLPGEMLVLRMGLQEAQDLRDKMETEQLVTEEATRMAGGMESKTLALVEKRTAIAHNVGDDSSDDGDVPIQRGRPFQRNAAAKAIGEVPSKYGPPARRNAASKVIGGVLVADSESASNGESSSSPDDADRPAIAVPSSKRKLKRKRSQTSHELVQTGRQTSSHKIQRQDGDEKVDQTYREAMNEIIAESKVRLVKKTYTYDWKWSARENR